MSNLIVQCVGGFEEPADTRAERRGSAHDCRFTRHTRHMFETGTKNGFALPKDGSPIVIVAFDRFFFNHKIAMRFIFQDPTWVAS